MLTGALALAALAAIVGVVLLYSGAYNVAASLQHSRPVYWVLDTGMRHSVRRHSSGIVVPDLTDPELLRTGAQCFHLTCAKCHGAPGIAREDIGRGLLPLPNDLTQTARDWPPEQIYWVTRHGIRMAGMPAWEARFSDRDLWAVVAFLENELPRLSVREYRERIRDVSEMSCPRPMDESARPDAARGRELMREYACHGCHRIPGIVGPDVYVGPPLEGFAHRAVIAGVLPNTRDNLIRWLRDPQSVSAMTVMPDLDVTAQHAADMAAYLESLD